jgi:hypothetical protein
MLLSRQDIALFVVLGRYMRKTLLILPAVTEDRHTHTRTHTSTIISFSHKYAMTTSIQIPHT